MPLHQSLSTVVESTRSTTRSNRQVSTRGSLDHEELDNPLERRITPRSVALEFRSWIGWMTSDGFVAVAARLMDISQGGVAIESVDAPAINQEVWFCLHPSETSFAVSGEVVRLDRGERDQHLIRVAFWAPCPASLLRWAVDGVRPPVQDHPPNPQTGFHSSFQSDDDATLLLEPEGPL